MSARYSRISYPKRSTVNGSSPCNRQPVSVPVYMLHTFFIVHSFPLSFSGHPASHFCVLHPHQRAFLFVRQRYMGVVEMKEFRLAAFALKKITMLSAPAPTFFSFKTFLIPLSRTSISRKKKAQTQMGNDSQSKKKSADKRPNQDKGFQKKGLNLAEE